MERGWLKFYRKITESECFRDPFEFKVFFWLITEANHEDKKWGNRIIKRGQKLTSIRKMSAMLDMSDKTIQRVLKKLVSYDSIKVHSDKAGGSLITIRNYDSYQCSAVNDTTQCTTLSTTPHTTLPTTQCTTKQELKELKNNTLSLSLSQEKEEKQSESYLEQAFEDELFMQNLQMLTKLDRLKAKKAISDADTAFKTDGNYPKNYGNYRMRVRQYVQTHSKDYKQLENGNTNTDKQSPGTTAKLLREQLEQFFINECVQP